MTKVLFTHQATVPAYRLDLFNLLDEEGRSENLQFTFVYSKRVSKREKLGFIDEHSFKLVNTKTAYILSGKLQSWIFDIGKYDCIVLENCFNNLTNLLAFPLCKILRKKIILIGHFRDNTRRENHWINRTKVKLYRFFDGILAYTEREAELFSRANRNVISFNNTINVESNRKALLEKFDNRKELRQNHGIEEGTLVLLYVGRIDSRKGFGEELLKEILGIDRLLLLVVGGHLPISSPNVLEFDYSADPAFLSDLFIASDLYIHPGDVGLGPISAVSFGLKPVFFDKKNHNPEEYYLNDSNSIRVGNESEFVSEIKNFTSAQELEERLVISDSIDFLSTRNSVKNIVKLISDAVN